MAQKSKTEQKGNVVSVQQTAIEDGILKIRLNDEWLDVGPVKVTNYANAVMFEADPNTPEGKEVIAVLDEQETFKYKGGGRFLMLNPADNQHDPANDIPEGVQQVGNNLG